MQKEFWDQRWKDQQTGWDLGAVSPPLKAYVDQLTDKNQKILVPGCGNAYEAEYLWKQGFSNTYIVEISELAIASFKKRYPEFPADHIFLADFFELKNQFDLIMEQTFFCAIDPSMRQAYAKQTTALLKPGGKLVGVLFDRAFEGGPPFGGNRHEYQQIFSPYFELHTFETAYNSITPRAGVELFINLRKRN